MMAASEAGKCVDEFMALPSYEYDWWTDHVINGASNMRTQMLLMQLIQIVAGALGGKPYKPDTLLPYFNDVFNIKPKDKKTEMHRRVKNTIEALLTDKEKGYK